MTKNNDIFEKYYQIKLDLEADHKRASDALRAFADPHKGSMGLLPDSVKFSAEYIQLKTNFNFAHKRLQAWNKMLLTHFKPEMRAKRLERHASHD